MKKILPVFLLILAISVLAFGSSLFIVDQWRQALVLRLGKAQRVVNAWDAPPEAGLHIKWPLLEEVIYFDKRNLELDIPPKEIVAADQERLVVDAFARYRIVDPLKYYRTVRNEAGARLRLSEILNSALRNILGKAESQDIISGKRADLMVAIRNLANEAAQQERVQAGDTEPSEASEDNKNTSKIETGLGLEIIDVRIKRADLPDANEKRVFERMRTERHQQAALIRAEGEERARTRRAEADRAVIVIKAEAQRDAERLRGQGDAERTDIYARAYELDPEFYTFSRSLKAYEHALKEGTSFVLSPDSDFFRYMKNPEGEK